MAVHLFVASTRAARSVPILRAFPLGGLPGSQKLNVPSLIFDILASNGIAVTVAILIGRWPDEEEGVFAMHWSILRVLRPHFRRCIHSATLMPLSTDASWRLSGHFGDRQGGETRNSGY